MDRRRTLTVACSRCRNQKLRCDRERPKCRRCENTKSECSYPAPPDRKRLAFERAQAKNAEAGIRREAPAHVSHRTYGNPPAQGPNSPSTESLYRRQRDSLLGGATPTGDLSHPAPPGVRLPRLREQSLQEGPGCVEVSKEVALFLIEIYFERHYQADLLFCKRDLIQSYNAGHISDHVSRAMFAFASVFLPPLAGGIISGVIDIGDVSQADWRTIGSRWSEQASQQALMNADKPSLELVQACQILALYWFAKAETTRTNMHTSVAYRACRLLHLDQTRGKSSVTDWSADRDGGMRCFWACWLTKCASRENARFHVDCWADVMGCPLPDDGSDGYPTVPARCLGQYGIIQDLGPTQQNHSVRFNDALIIIQGLWWEVQQFVQAVNTTCSKPNERVSEFCSLSRRLEELPDEMPEFTHYELGRQSSRFSSAGQGRIFSLTYLYHLCVVYLHSSVVPVLSCSTQNLPISRAMIRLAAEQAWEHSVSLTTMTEQFIAGKAAISKSWAVVGYGAYVCAAIQLRRFLALGVLTHQRLQDTKVHLHLTGELSKYWMTLRPLHEDMERQFSQAHALISSSQVNRTQGKDDQRGELTRLIVQPESGQSPELSSHLRTYVANDDIQKQDNQSEQQHYNGPVIAVQVHDASPASNIPQASDHIPLGQTVGLNTGSERPQIVCEPSIEGSRWEFVPQPNWALGEDGIWGNQDLESLGDVFGSGFFLHDDMGFQMDIH